jgi:hypothetical protein
MKRVAGIFSEYGFRVFKIIRNQASSFSTYANTRTVAYIMLHIPLDIRSRVEGSINCGLVAAWGVRFIYFPKCPDNLWSSYILNSKRVSKALSGREIKRPKRKDSYTSI